MGWRAAGRRRSPQVTGAGRACGVQRESLIVHVREQGNYEGGGAGEKWRQAKNSPARADAGGPKTVGRPSATMQAVEMPSACWSVKSVVGRSMR